MVSLTVTRCFTFLACCATVLTHCDLFLVRRGLYGVVICNELSDVFI